MLSCRIKKFEGNNLKGLELLACSASRTVRASQWFICETNKTGKTDCRLKAKRLLWIWNSVVGIGLQLFVISAAAIKDKNIHSWRQYICNYY